MPKGISANIVSFSASRQAPLRKRVSGLILPYNEQYVCQLALAVAVDWVSAYPWMLLHNSVDLFDDGSVYS